MEDEDSVFNFDITIERRDTDSVKWNREIIGQIGGNPDALPFWVADMDFPPPQEVIDAMLARAIHPVYGYPTGSSSLVDAFRSWVLRIHGWDTGEDNVTFVPGMLTGIAAALISMTRRGDGIILQTPAYRPFYSIIELNERRIVRNPLLREQKGAAPQFYIDFSDLEKKMSDPHNTVLLLCSPHNPSGRVWSAQELERIIELAAAYGVGIISDEIHADLTYPQHCHIPLSLTEKTGNSITFMAPSKTFNIAGEKCAFAVTRSPDLSRALQQRLDGMALSHPTLFAPAAAQAAYRHGEAWMRALIPYLQRNLDYMEQAITRDIPGLQLLSPQASFIAFIDCRAILPRLGGKDPSRFFSTEAGILLHDGMWFGPEGEGYVRINFGSPLSSLAAALSRMATAVEKLG